MSGVIRTEAREMLLSIDYVERLALAVVDLGLSRRKTPDWLASVIFGWAERGGTIIDGAGREIDIDDDLIDHAHGRDGSFTCVSVLKRSAFGTRRRKPRKALLRRLELYDAAFKIIEKPVKICT